VKISIPQALRFFVVLGSMLAITVSMADAQQMGLPYTEAPFTPLAPLTPQIMSSGRWYIAGGARWRQGQKVSFDKPPASGGYTVPFGPRVPGDFSFTPARNNAGVWIYDNGDINPNNPQQNPQVSRLFQLGGGNTSTVETNPGDSAWTNSTSLGALVFQWANPTPGTPNPFNWSYYNVGSFSVQNINQFSPLLPTPATATFGNATSVSYDLTLNQLPQPPTVTDGGFTSQAFDNSTWGPYVEIGFWSGSFVSLTYSFSAFSFSNSFQKNIPATLYPNSTSLTDSYNFSSIGFNTDGTPAPPNPTLINANFSSIKIGNSASGNCLALLYSYSLDPLSGNREFNLPPLAVIENLSVGLNANCYENRLAVLNMGPVLPPFELGMSLGPVATLVHFTLNYQNIILDPNNPANVLLTNIGSQVKDQWSFGAFGSLDLRVSLPNTFFGCSFDYVYMSDIRHELDYIQSTISPGGRSLNFIGGLKF